MREYTVTKREGEYLGPVDWDYDFINDTNRYPGIPEETRLEYLNENISWVKELDEAENIQEYSVSNYGGCPKIWNKALKVGMYDGWPYWRPRPAVLMETWHGSEWVWWDSLTGLTKDT